MIKNHRSNLVVQILFYFYFFSYSQTSLKASFRSNEATWTKNWLSLRSIVIRRLLSTVLAIPSWGPRGTFLKSDTRSRATGSTPTKPQKTWKEDVFERLLVVTRTWNNQRLNKGRKSLVRFKSETNESKNL